MKVDLTKVKGEGKYSINTFIRQRPSPSVFLVWEITKRYAQVIEAMFILNSTQWEYILSEWELKENLLTY